MVEPPQTPGSPGLPQPPLLPKTPQSSGFRRLVVMLAIVASVAAAVVVLRDSSRPRSEPAPPVALDPAPEADPGPESEAERAMRLAGIDSTKKNEWVDELPGSDLSGLDPVRREIFLRFANARRCTCGCGFTLAACRQFDSTCDVSGPLVAALLDSVSRGLVTDTRALRKRPESAVARPASE